MPSSCPPEHENIDLQPQHQHTPHLFDALFDTGTRFLSSNIVRIFDIIVFWRYFAGVWGVLLSGINFELEIPLRTHSVDDCDITTRPQSRTRNLEISDDDYCGVWACRKFLRIVYKDWISWRRTCGSECGTRHNPAQHVAAARTLFLTTSRSLKPTTTLADTIADTKQIRRIDRTLSTDRKW